MVAHEKLIVVEERVMVRMRGTVASLMNHCRRRKGADFDRTMIRLRS
jgi:hypothetical protein